jgi:hypothetical protein
MSHTPGITNLPVPSITLSEAGMVIQLRPADSGNVVSADEKGHVLWLANSWIDDGDMCERKAAGLCVNHPRKP